MHEVFKLSFMFLYIEAKLHKKFKWTLCSLDVALINVLWYLQEGDSVAALTGDIKTQFGGLCRTLRERQEAPSRPREGKMQAGMGNIKEPSEPLRTWLGGSGLRRGWGRECWGINATKKPFLVWRGLSTLRAAWAQLGERGGSWDAGRPSVPACEAPPPEDEVRLRPARATAPRPQPRGSWAVRARPGGRLPRGPGLASGRSRAAPGVPEAPRTHLHEAVCVRKSRQHHLFVGLGRARCRRGLGFSGAGRRHISGLHGSSRESARVDATCVHYACAKAFLGECKVGC